MRGAHVVGVYGGRRRYAGAYMRRRHWRTPAVAVHIVVVGAHIAVVVNHACEGPVFRHIPHNLRRVQTRRAEAQVLGCVVHAAGAVQPYTLQLERHVDLFACVGIVAVYPQLVVGRVDALCPYLVDEHIGLDFVIITAVDHHLVLPVQVINCSVGLAAGEVVDGRG